MYSLGDVCGFGPAKCRPLAVAGVLALPPAVLTLRAGGCCGCAQPALTDRSFVVAGRSLSAVVGICVLGIKVGCCSYLMSLGFGGSLCPLTYELKSVSLSISETMSRRLCCDPEPSLSFNGVTASPLPRRSFSLKVARSVG